MKSRFTAAVILIAILITGAGGCGGESTPVTPSEPASESSFEWPDKLYITASSTSVMTKYVSWASVMERDTGMAVVVVPEANPEKRWRLVADGTMFICSGGKSGSRNITEAIEEYTTRDSGGFPMRIAWINAVSHSGVFVRGDSDIYTLDDIKPGVRWSLWSTTASLTKVPKAVLDWAQVDHDDVTWVVAGSSEGAVRAITEGRADIMWFFPISSYVYEAGAAPHGIRWIDLNSEADPEGAARFREWDAMYTFGIMGQSVHPTARGHWGTIGEKYMTTSADSDADMVYHFAKWLDENYDNYKDKHGNNAEMSLEKLMNGLNTTYVPCHEGLIRYLREKGLWTEAHERRQAHNIVILDVYIKAYAEAIALADEAGIEVSPVNTAWIDLWENYKLSQGLPRIAQHQSLSVDAPWVAALGLE